MFNAMALGSYNKKKRWIRPIVSPPSPPNPTPKTIIGGIIVISIIVLPIVAGITAIIRSIIEIVRTF